MDQDSVCRLTATHVMMAPSHYFHDLSQSLCAHTCPVHPPNLSTAPTSQLQPTRLLQHDFPTEAVMVPQQSDGQYVQKKNSII